MIDAHMHLEYGELSAEYILQFIKVAQDKGINKIQILDHTHRFKEFEPMYEQLKAYEVQKVWLENKKMKFKDTLADYEKVIKTIKAMNLSIEVTFGLEVCYVPEYETFLKNLLSNYKFDFLVGAVHSIDGILYDMPFSKDLLWDKFNVNDIYKRYYELIFELVESDIFTQLAHPDTIKLFNYYPDYDLKPTYQHLAELLNQHQMKAENNTGCYYRYHHKDMGLSDELLAVFKKNHVEMVTASDAHKPEHVGSCIQEIWDKTML